MPTMPEVLSAEIHRCRQVARDCQALGSSGAFASALLEQALREADAALRSRDTHVIEQTLHRLRGFREVQPETAIRAPSGIAGQVGRAVGARPAAPPVRERFFTWNGAA